MTTNGVNPSTVKRPIKSIIVTYADGFQPSMVYTPEKGSAFHRVVTNHTDRVDGRKPFLDHEIRWTEKIEDAKPPPPVSEAEVKAVKDAELEV